MKEKDDQRSLHHHHHPRFHNRLLHLIKKLLTNPTAYFILLLLFYALGYISTASSCTQPPPPPPQSHVSSSRPSVIQSTNLPPTLLDNFRVTTDCADSIPPQLVRPTILDKIFNGSSPYTNFPPPHVSQLLRRSRIKGWGSYGAVFKHLINKVKPRVIIEVGTFLGASALHMSNLTRQLGLDTQILCIDDFRGWPGFRDKLNDIQMINGNVLLYYQFMQNVIYHDATELVLPVPFSSGSALMKLCEWGVAGDLIEIDAGHDFNSAWADINRAWRILRPGGVIFGHDYFTAADNRGVRRAVNLFAKINGLQIHTDGQHWVIYSSVNQ
ncbi:S-adenosyl-L-methionine-dependent methyltransferase [Melia azedarach]|uniref:S-adenosyl-L-methionine-dependent methyltransferase n=1 Tax=Melia azedarach TaxID=155640 RepID=A0ACC1YWF6_MELAZ|nr:S-adenosyl-L-methionine-dependent methyltransferase [Melia azedarach]